jgi:serine/threonine-protein kinase HipA
LLKGSDQPAADRITVLNAQMFFWLIGATDGHAKNFSVFLGPGDRYHLTPLYDVLTGQPSFDAGQIDRRHMKLSMSVGTNRHYRIGEIRGRHFVQTGKAAGLAGSVVLAAIEKMADTAQRALQKIKSSLPADFPLALHTSVSRGVMERVELLLIGTKDKGSGSARSPSGNRRPSTE